jgi:aminodeoxychorismate synthase component I
MVRKREISANFSFEKDGILPQADGMPILARVPRPVALDLTPLEAAAACRHLPGRVFFDTAAEGGEAGQISIVAAKPCEMVRGTGEGAWAALERAVRERLRGPHCDDGLPAGFAAGFVEYDGALCFGIYEDALIYRHGEQRWYEVGDISGRLRLDAPVRHSAGPRFRPLMGREEFYGRVRRAQEYIAAGDIYQVNLSHRFTSQWDGEAFCFYEALRHYSPAPYGAFLDLADRAILSSSPESFLKISGRAIRTRPIKGTRPRRAEANADALSAYELRNSPKEIAELVMITDLERNDLGAICEFGSVHVKELLKLESHEHVFHLVSTVEGRLREEIGHVEALRSCFPGGSITGAPKKRAREIIAELEPEPRGVYTGALGWFGFNGESQFNIAIRTVMVEDGRAHFHVGAGIVADSIPEKEWQETLDKAAGILLAAERCGSPDGRTSNTQHPMTQACHGTLTGHGNFCSPLHAEEDAAAVKEAGEEEDEEQADEGDDQIAGTAGPAGVEEVLHIAAGEARSDGFETHDLRGHVDGERIAADPDERLAPFAPLENIDHIVKQREKERAEA